MTRGPLNILFLIDKLVPAGTQTNLLRLVQGMDRVRFRPHLISLAEAGGLCGQFTDAGVPPVVLGVKKAYGISGLRAAFFLYRFLKRERIDILQTFFLQADILGSIAGKSAGVRGIVTARRDEGFWMSARQRAASRWTARAARAVLVNSEAVKAAVMRNENPGIPVHVIPNGVDAEKFAPSPAARAAKRAELGIRAGETAVGVVANMRHEIKGYDYLFRAAERLRRAQAGPGVRYFLAGDGPLRVRYEQTVRDLGIAEDFSFLGTRDDIPDLIQAFDVCCLPSLTEGFSNAVLEFMAAGKAVLATRVGGNPEVIEDGVTGLLVPGADSPALAEGLLRLARDPAFMQRVGAAARARVIRDFSIGRMIEQYETFYETFRG